MNYIKYNLIQVNPLYNKIPFRRSIRGGSYWIDGDSGKSYASEKYVKCLDVGIRLCLRKCGRRPPK